MIGSWSGERYAMSFSDSHLQEHLNQLDKLEHSISQISIGHPHNPTERPEYTKWIKSLKETKNGTPIKVHDVPNIGRSYGQWSRMFNMYRDQFTHFIFIEDDYAPVLDNFDKALLEMFEEQPKTCGFLCGLILDRSGRYGRVAAEPHAGVSNGISSNSVLKEVWRKFNCLPHDKQEYKFGQYLFSRGFYETGYTLQEYLYKFRCLYFQHTNVIRKYWDGEHDLDIIVPIQYLDKSTEWEIKEFLPDTPAPRPPIRPPIPQTSRLIPSPLLKNPNFLRKRRL
jgi:hypothetical protein